jgi:hypothetical protein
MGPLKTWVSTLILTDHGMMGTEIRKIYRANKFTCCRQGGTSIPGTDCHDHPSTYRLSYHQSFVYFSSMLELYDSRSRPEFRIRYVLGGSAEFGESSNAKPGRFVINHVALL